MECVNNGGVDMGYIAPITHYQYQQYANRMESTSRSYQVAIPVTKIKKVHNERFSEILLKSSNSLSYESNMVKLNDEENNWNGEAARKLLAEITGMGMHINEDV
jgi:hypothetical protein